MKVKSTYQLVTMFKIVSINLVLLSSLNALEYDVVLENGRVMDPETFLDAVKNVGIKDGKIAAVTNDKIVGKETIDVKGLVVAPGFIDTHAHSVDIIDGWLLAQDGVTTQLELEYGRHPVGEAYKYISDRGHPLNYGFSSGWEEIRATVITGNTYKATWDGGIAAFVQPWGVQVATDTQLEQILARLKSDIDDGALGIGYPPAYGSGAGTIEAIKMWKLAADNNVPVSVHVRYQSMIDPNSSVQAMSEMLGYAASSGAHAVLCHIQLLGLSNPYEMLDVIKAGREAGLNLTTEVYPFGVTAPPISADYLKWDNADERIGFKWNEVRTEAKPQYTFKDEADFRRWQKEKPGSFVQMQYIDESTEKGLAAMRASIVFPNTIPAADGTPINWEGKPKHSETYGLGTAAVVWPVPADAEGQPRTASTHAVMIEKWVRKHKALTLMQVIRRSSYIPASEFENEIPQFKTKGRLQVGMDADITVFKPEEVKANATWKNVGALNDGFYHTLVNGQFVLKNGEIQQNVLAGTPIRNEQKKK